MKQSPYFIAIAFIGLFAAESVWSQQSAGRGMFARFLDAAEGAEIICDILLLHGEEAEKARAACQEAMNSQTDAMGDVQRWRDLPQETRMREMRALRARQADAVIGALKEIELVSEAESRVVRDVIATGRLVVIAPIRALRLIELEAYQLEAFRPVVLEVVEAQPGFGFVPGGRQDHQQQEARDEFDKKMTDLTIKVASLLSNYHVQAWRESIQKIESDQQRRLEEIIRQRGAGSGQPRGGGRR